MSFWRKEKEEPEPDPRPQLAEMVVAIAAYYGGIDIPTALDIGKRFHVATEGKQMSAVELLTWLDNESHA